MEKILYKNRFYKTRTILLKEFGEVTIGSTSLSEILFDNEKGYANESVRLIDEKIFYFVPAEYFSFSDEKLAEKITAEIV